MREGPIPQGYVVDSSVVVRWYLPQVGFEHAREVRDLLVEERLRLEAPALLRWEVGNVLRITAVLGGLITPAVFRAHLAELPVLGVVLHSDDEATVLAAADLALTLGVSLFDAAFVELALRTGLPLLTADARLARSVAGLVSTEVLRGIVPGAAPT